MTTSALITMITVQVLFTGVTLYFFYKVLKTPLKEDDLDE